MPDTIKTGTILIKEGTHLPKVLRVESEPCAPGWRFLVHAGNTFGKARFFGRCICTLRETLATRSNARFRTLFATVRLKSFLPYDCQRHDIRQDIFQNIRHL